MRAFSPRPKGPYCPLLTEHLLATHLAFSPAAPARPIRASTALAKAQLRRRERTQSEWTLAFVARNAALLGPDASGLPEALFALALVVQRRDVELARFCFRRALVAAVGVQDAAMTAKYLVAWGLLESKQPGTMERARALLRRAVAVDERKAPVLGWKVFWT